MLFKAHFEIKDNAVTLSMPLVKYMLKHNRGGRKSLRVVAFKYGNDESVIRYGLDINPPFTEIEKEIQETYDEIQFNPDARQWGFLMEYPTVSQVFMDYEMFREEFVEESDLYIEPVFCEETDRTIYIIRRPDSLWLPRLRCWITKMILRCIKV